VLENSSYSGGLQALLLFQPLPANLEIPQVHQWAGMCCEDMWKGGPFVLDAMDKWPGSEEPAHCGFALANGFEMSFFDHISRNPVRFERFAGGMVLLQSAPVVNLSHLLDNIRWDKEPRPALLVDVGGSHGSVTIEALRKYKFLHAVVQDLPEVVGTAEVPEDLQNRMNFQAHDFFTVQPQIGADVYLLRNILHDWSDKYAIKILKSLVPALKHGAKIILNEICLPEPGKLPLYEEQFLRGFDLSLKQNFNAKERDADEWEALLEKGDPRFKIKGIVQPPHSLFAIIEVIWEDKL